MNFLPVFQRELLVAARRGSAGWIRFLAALGGMGFFVLLWLTPLQSRPQAVSDIAFRVLAGSLFAYALLAGALYTADAITSERREGTLGLLFLTELRGYDIILGKLVATSIQSVYVIGALIPVLALPVLVGGVSGGQVARMVVTVCVTLGGSLAIGMIASALAREFRTALMATAISLGVLTVGTDSGGWAWERLTGRTAEGFRACSPLAAFRWSQAEPWRKPMTHAAFNRAWKRQVLGTVLLLTGASFAVRFRRDSVMPARVVAEDEGKVRADSLVGYRHVHWGLLLERQPYAWFHRVMRPLPAVFSLGFYSMGGLVVAVLVFSAFLSTTSAAWAGVSAAMGLLWLMHLFLKVHVTLAATRGIAEDRASGALELLVVAGQDRDQIIPAHRSAILAQHHRPLLTLLILQLVPVVRLGMTDLAGAPAMGVCLGLVLGGVVTWIDLESLIRVGLRHGLREGNPQAAFRATFLRVMLPAWIGLLPVAALTFASPRLAGIALLIWLGFTAYTVNRARKRARIDLEHGFRDLSAGLRFDTDEWELRDDFRRAAGVRYMGGRRVAW